MRKRKMKSKSERQSRSEQMIFELMDCPCHPEPIDWDWFCKNSRLFERIDYSTSEELAVKHGCTIKHCYYNTWKVDVLGRYTYYEGYAIRDDIPLRLAHSWLVDDQARVIDPTLAVREDREDYANQYIGIAMDRDWLNKIAFKLKRTGDFLPQWYEQHR